ncbi:hypothetical protein [Limnoglobus roseus]|uniref:hypothetical protein n=1 Tax=Limnoglobus roseus TaxID=2598579 RepID=UPI001FE78D50|nr:hypothetical protein [Limnoglobus roseus]
MERLARIPVEFGERTSERLKVGSLQGRNHEFVGQPQQAGGRVKGLNCGAVAVESEAFGLAVPGLGNSRPSQHDPPSRGEFDPLANPRKFVIEFPVIDDEATMLKSVPADARTIAATDHPRVGIHQRRRLRD